MKNKALLIISALAFGGVVIVFSWFDQDDHTSDSSSGQPAAITAPITLSSSQPYPTEPNNINQSNVMVVSQPNYPTASVTSSAPVMSESVYSTGLPPDKNDPVKLEQRKRVFTEIAKVTNNLSRGIAPNPVEVLKIIDESIELTQEGYVPIQDAMNTLDFLKKVIPELDLEIYRRMQDLN